MYECTVGPIFNEKVVKKKRFVGFVNSVKQHLHVLLNYFFKKKKLEGRKTQNTRHWPFSSISKCLLSLLFPLYYILTSRQNCYEA